MPTLASRSHGASAKGLSIPKPAVAESQRLMWSAGGLLLTTRRMYKMLVAAPSARFEQPPNLYIDFAAIAVNFIAIRHGAPQQKWRPAARLLAAGCWSLEHPAQPERWCWCSPRYLLRATPQKSNSGRRWTFRSARLRLKRWSMSSLCCLLLVLALYPPPQRSSWDV